MEELATIIAKLIKIIGWILLLCAIVLIVYALYWWMDGYHWRAQKNKVTAGLSVNKKRCSDKNYPFLISFSNNSSYKIKRIDFSPMSQRVGFSSNLFVGNYWESDAIIPPQKSYSSCWTTPKLAVPENKYAELTNELLGNPKKFNFAVEIGNIDFVK